MKIEVISRSEKRIEDKPLSALRVGQLGIITMSITPSVVPVGSVVIGANTQQNCKAVFPKHNEGMWTHSENYRWRELQPGESVTFTSDKIEVKLHVNSLPVPELPVSSLRCGEFGILTTVPEGSLSAEVGDLVIRGFNSLFFPQFPGHLSVKECEDFHCRRLTSEDQILIRD